MDDEMGPIFFGVAIVASEAAGALEWFLVSPHLCCFRGDSGLTRADSEYLWCVKHVSVDWFGAGHE